MRGGTSYIDGREQLAHAVEDAYDRSRAGAPVQLDEQLRILDDGDRATVRGRIHAHMLQVDAAGPFHGVEFDFAVPGERIRVRGRK